MAANPRAVAAVDGALMASESPPFDHPLPIVALHGWGRSRADLAALHDLGGVTAFDLPGHGSAPAPNDPCGAHGYATIIAAALDEPARTGRPALVVGHSFGGRVAVCLAADRPDLVAGLVLSGVPLQRATTAGRPVAAVRRARLLHRLHLISDQRLEEVRYRYGSADYRAATGVMREVLVRVVNEDYSDELASLRCPVTMIWGSADTAAPVERARRAAAVIPVPVDFIELAGGHDVHLSQRAEFVGAVATMRARLLDRIGSGST